MRRMPKLQGVLTPNITPMKPDGTLDLKSYARLAQTLLDAPAINGLFGIGATGEYTRLSVNERVELIHVLGQLDRHGKIITANAGGTPTVDTLFLMEKIAAANLDAAAVVLPTHVPENNAAILDFYTRVNDVGIPFMVYQPPTIKTHQLTLELVAELLELPYFVGLKDSSRDLMLFSELCYLFGDEISIIQGVEMLQLPALVCGSAGIVGGGANLYPGLLAKLNAVFAAGDLSGTRTIQHEIIASWRKMVEGNAFRTWVKQVWRERGVIETAKTRMDENKPLASPEQLQLLLALLDLGENKH